ncbi:MAG TPA: response regulator [Kofleriaceae bacterium]|nr:response regulator [Kofleriaceae bacterium]
MRVLVVEDHAALAEAFAESIRRNGHEAFVAITGASAVTMARTHAPHAVLLDIGLPDMDGYVVARTMREQGLSPSTVIIMVTGKTLEPGGDAGVDLVLQKPVESEMLAGLVEYLSRRTTRP